MTEEKLKTLVKEIVSDYINMKFMETNSFHNDSRSFILEGLTMSYDIKKMISMLKKKYDEKTIGCKFLYLNRTDKNHPINTHKPLSDNEWQVYGNNKLQEINVNFPYPYGFKNVTKELLNDIIHTCDVCGWMFASIVDMFDLKQYKNLNDVDFNKKTCYNIYFRPKFDQIVHEDVIPKICYHICPLRLVDKILKQGLHPKDFGRVSNHPERVFLWHTLNNSWKNIASEFKESRTNEPYALLSIDMTKLKNHIKFFYDSLTSSNGFAIYTYEPIPYDAISLCDKEDNK